MKKFIVLALSLSLLLGVTACSSSDGDESSSSGSDSSSSSVGDVGGDMLPESGDMKMGSAVISKIDGSTSYTADASALARTYTTICSLVLDDGGKISDIYFDQIEAKVNFDEAGQLETDTSVQPKTKRELGDDYGMKPASPIGKEWYEQIDALEEYMIGKTADDITSFSLKETDDGKMVPDEPDLVSSCTIDVQDFIEAAEKAVAGAK